MEAHTACCVSCLVCRSANPIQNVQICGVVLYSSTGRDQTSVTCANSQWLLITYACNKGSDCRTFSGVATLMKQDVRLAPTLSKVQEKLQLGFAASTCEFQTKDQPKIGPTFPQRRQRTNPGICIYEYTIVYDY